jgi:hypothetical protein
LAAVVTILGAKTAFGIHQKVELYGFSEMLFADFKSRVDQFHKLFVGGFENRQGLQLCHRGAIEDFRGQIAPIFGDARWVDRRGHFVPCDESDSMGVTAYPEYSARSLLTDIVAF